MRLWLGPLRHDELVYKRVLEDEGVEEVGYLSGRYTRFSLGISVVWLFHGGFKEAFLWCLDGYQ